MTKLAEKAFLDGNRLQIVETHDFTPVLNRAASLRSSGAFSMGESKRIASIPMHLWAMWAREAGLQTNDPAMKEVLARKLNDPDYAQFRVWGGRI